MKVLEPITIGRMELRNRIVMTPIPTGIPVPRKALMMVWIPTVTVLMIVLLQRLLSERLLTIVLTYSGAFVIRFSCRAASAVSSFTSITGQAHLLPHSLNATSSLKALPEPV